eukprot:scaffold126469_cov17-Tisochrysis_lutea.AAC.1
MGRRASVKERGLWSRACRCMTMKQSLYQWSKISSLLLCSSEIPRMQRPEEHEATSLHDADRKAYFENQHNRAFLAPTSEDSWSHHKPKDKPIPALMALAFGTNHLNPLNCFITLEHQYHLRTASMMSKSQISIPGSMLPMATKFPLESGLGAL